MNLTEKDLQEFIGIWKREFGETITLDQARHEGTLLLELYYTVGQMLPGERRKGIDAEKKKD